MTWPTKIYVATKTLGVYYTSNFIDPSIQPTWAAVNGGLPTTDVRQFAVDPFAPEDKQYLLLEATRTLYRRDNGGNWAAILTVAQAEAAAGAAGGTIFSFCTDPSIAGRLWVLYGSAGVNAAPHAYYALYSDDYGATWTGTPYMYYESNLTYGASAIRAYGDNVWAGFSGYAGSWSCVAYSSNKGGTWGYASSQSKLGLGWDKPLFLNPLQPDRVYTGNFEANPRELVSVTSGGTVTVLASGICPYYYSSMWFDPTDANHQRILPNTYLSTALCVTTDGWATNNSGAGIAHAPISIAPWSGADEDQMIVGLTPASGSQPHTIGTLYGESDVTATGIAGANCETTPFADSIPDTCGGVANGGVAAYFSVTVRLLSITPRTDRTEYVSRIYPRASGVSLADTSRTATAPYVLDAVAGYIRNSDAETNIGRRDRSVPLPVDMPTTYNSLTLKQQYAADKLFDEALEWLGKHDTIADFYIIRVAGLTELFALGQTIHVTTTTTVNGEAAYVIDSDFNVMLASWEFDDGGELIAVMEISTIEREAASDAQVVAGAVISAARNAGGSSGGTSVSTVVTQVSGIASIVGGTIDGTVIGGMFPEAGTFTEVVVTGALVLPVKAAHAALMGPVSGADAIPDFRGIIALDLPGTISADHIGERTGGHTVVFDNTVTLPASTIVPNGGTIGQVAGPMLTFDDASNYLGITGCAVGIGTTAPKTKLDIVGTGGVPSGTPPFPVRITSGLSTTPGFIFERSDASKFINMWTGSIAAVLGFTDTVVRLGIGTYPYANRYSLSMPTTEIMSLLPIGNVGIGTTVPSYLLSLGSEAARQFWVERRNTVNNAGSNLIVEAGGSTNNMVSTIAVVAGGVEYSPTNILTLALPSGGTAATVTVATIAATGGLKTLAIVAGGTGYTPGTVVLTVVQAGASDGIISCTADAGGIIVSIQSVTAIGTGYSVATPLATTGGGNNDCTVNLSVINGAVATVTLTTKGAKYTTGTKATTVVPVGGTGCTISVATIESATDKAGGTLYLDGGISSGTGFSAVEIRSSPAGASGATDNTPTTLIKLSDNKLGFFGATPGVRPTALTTQLTSITYTAPGAPDYAFQDLVAGGYGFVTKDEGNSMLAVTLNLQTRVGEIETKIKVLGLFA